MENFNDKLEHLQEQQSKAKELFDVKKAEMEQAKEYFIKCQGAIEVIQSMIDEEENKEVKKDNKK